MNITVKNGTAARERLIGRPLSAPRISPREVKRAFCNAEFSLAYQPMIDLRTARITSCEALLRWNHPIGGQVLPDKFLNIAEEIGIMPRLERWVLHAALTEAATWPEGIRVAVNISAAQFHLGDLPQVVSEALTATNLDPSRLELEIIETVQPSADDTFWGTLHQLRRVGVHLAIDDFGVGHSSVDRLYGFAFDKIKIDRSFVGGFPERPDQAAFIREVIQLGAELGITTTAEGVETRSELAGLRAERCTEVQGFFFSHARPSGEIRSFITYAQHEGVSLDNPKRYSEA